MGTETTTHHCRTFVCTNHLVVKLNNPLMGTETGQVCLKYGWVINLDVKLNNPLMGTETVAVVNIFGTFIVPLN